MQEVTKISQIVDYDLTNEQHVLEMIKNFFVANDTIDIEQIIESVPDIDISIEQMEWIIKQLRKDGISISNNHIKQMKEEYEEIVSIVPTEDEIYSSFDGNITSDVRDIVKQYLLDIGKYPLLTFEQEQELAKLAKEGDLEARNKLIMSNCRLVINFAKQNNNKGLPFIDVIFAGNLGLIKAVEKFDYTKGNKFSTYACWWIQQSIKRSIADQGKLIRLPVHVGEMLTKIKKYEKLFFQHNQVEPTAEDLAKLMQENGVSIDVSTIINYKRLSLIPLSLDKPTKDDEDSTTGDFIADETVDGPEKFADDELKNKLLQEAMDRILTDKEKDVLRYRFGLTPDGKTRTLQEISDIYGLTKERIRQIEKKALYKLKQYKETFRPFMNK